MDAPAVYFTRQAAPPSWTKVATITGGQFWWMALTGRLGSQEACRAALADLGHDISAQPDN